MPKNRRSRSRSRPKNHKRDSNRERDRQRNSYHHRNSRRSSSSSSVSPSSDDRDQSVQEKNYIPNYKAEETKTLKIQNCTKVSQAEKALISISIQAGTSVPDDIELRQNDIYAKYPSIEVAASVLKFLEESISIGGSKYPINFYPYRKIDLNLSYDWYCEGCEYKNFARRNRCYRCEAQKTTACKQIYNSTATYNPKKMKTKDENINNCSLMIRGSVITRLEQEVILDILEKIAPIKDIRMIKNRMTGQFKDYAFIQFYSPDQAAIALKQTTSPDFRIQGEKVTVMYSYNKSEDEFTKSLPYEKRERRWKEKKANDQPVESYYKKQRQMEIEMEKQRPLITMDQLKQKVEQEMKKKTLVHKQMTAEQNQRRQAQQMARQWERQVKIQNSILYICALCRRKFENEDKMKEHEQLSQLHKYNLERQSLAL